MPRFVAIKQRLPSQLRKLQPSEQKHIYIYTFITNMRSMVAPSCSFNGKNNDKLIKIVRLTGERATGRERLQITEDNAHMPH